MNVVELDRVRKTFRNHVAVEELSLQIPQGRVYGFIGPNGAGKTTTIRMIMNILPPDRGEVRVLGGPVNNVVKDRVGYLPEERGMYRKMKVDEILRFCARLKGMARGDIEPEIDRWLQRLGLYEWKYKRVEELSKGMGQKVQFISTVLHEPELVILDEPFAGLDPVNTEVLTEIVLDLKREGKSVIFSTHVMEQAEKLCDSVFMICRGRKVLNGTLEEIRRPFSDDTLEVMGEGDFDAVSDLDGVHSVRATEGRAEIFLDKNTDPQSVLRGLVPRVRIRKFELRTPTLHDIFLRVAGNDALEKTE